MAQVSASLDLTSNYLYRGVSLSQGKPALGLTMNYDHESGAYVGGSAAVEATPSAGLQPLGLMGYVGYSGRTDAGPSWDIGLTNFGVSDYDYGKYTADVTQIYAGLRAKVASLYLYYSPDYFGSGVSTIYLDLESGVRLTPRWRLFGHAGLLNPLDPGSGYAAPHRQYDFGAGIAAHFRRAEIKLGFTLAGASVDYLSGEPQSRGAVMLALSCFF